MSDNKGMILILLLIMTSCILSLHQLNDTERGLYQNEEIQRLYE